MSARTEAEFDFEICNREIIAIAEALIDKYDELHHIDPDKILFVMNHSAADGKKQMSLAKTSKIQPKWTDILYQLDGGTYCYMIEFYAKTTACMDEAQMVALVYRELRRIGPDGELLTPDIHDWWQMLMGLGRKWFYPDATCPNLLDENVNWKTLMGTHYEEPKD